TALGPVASAVPPPAPAGAGLFTFVAALGRRFGRRRPFRPGAWCALRTRTAFLAGRSVAPGALTRRAPLGVALRARSAPRIFPRSALCSFCLTARHAALLTDPLTT